MMIKSESSYWAWVATFAGLMTTGFMGIIVHLLQSQGRGSWWHYLFITPFVLMGAGLSWWGLRGLVRLARFGHWHLEVAGPGVLGHAMDVRLLPHRDVTPVDAIECHLYCMRSSTITTGTNVSTNLKTLWQSTWNVKSSAILKQEGLNLSLPLPEPDAADFDRFKAFGPKPAWKLTVTVPLRGLSYAPMFEIPVRMGR